MQLIIRTIYKYMYVVHVLDNHDYCIWSCSRSMNASHISVCIYRVAIRICAFIRMIFIAYFVTTDILPYRTSNSNSNSKVKVK